MESQVPKAYIVHDCVDCGTKHALIRECPQENDLVPSDTEYFDELEMEDGDPLYDREADYWFWSGDGS